MEIEGAIERGYGKREEKRRAGRGRERVDAWRERGRERVSRGEGGLGIAGSSAGYVRLAGRAVGQQLPKWSGKQYPVRRVKSGGGGSSNSSTASSNSSSSIAGSSIRRSVGWPTVSIGPWFASTLRQRGRRGSQGASKRGGG